MAFSVLIVDDSMPMRLVIKKPFAPEQLRDILVDLLGEVDYEKDLDAECDEFDF